jgi:thiol-disulfide isomerase/thioredoxin
MNTILLVLAFVAVCILVYKLWKPFLKPPVKELPPNEANLYFFYTDWCGHSQKAMPEWEKIEETFKVNSHYGKTRVKAIRVDCEKDKKTAMLYGINAYPTVILETKDGIIDYNKKVDEPTLKTFLRQSLGKED